MLKNSRVNRQFVISVADLIFHVEPNLLTITDGKQVLSTEFSTEEAEVLQAFSLQAQSILSPLANSKVIYSITDGPQKISLLKKYNDYMLIINSQIQFTTKSEEIYHEALVIPAFGAVKEPKKCLILGGGDGLAAKQIFKHYPETEVTLVDFDKNITDMFTHDPIMAEINQGAMSKCKVINADAYEYVDTETEKYDIIICDFPDPDTDIFNKLYSTEMYKKLKKLLNKNGTMAVQSGSLVPNSKSFKCIEKTLRASGFRTMKYYTPTTYGELIYNLCSHSDSPDFDIKFPKNLNTMDQQYFWGAMRNIRPGFISKETVEVNTVDNMAALRYRIEELESIKK